jgi:hypothetical protein
LPDELISARIARPSSIEEKPSVNRKKTWNIRSRLTVILLLVGYAAMAHGLRP